MTTSTRDTKDPVRAGFEEWFENRYCFEADDLFKIGAWNGWQAATQHKAEQDTVVVSRGDLNKLRRLLEQTADITNTDFKIGAIGMKLVKALALLEKIGGVK